MPNSLSARGLIKKSFLWFVLFYITFYILFQAFFKMLEKNEEERDVRQTSIIQETVKDRFNLYLKLPLNIALIGADYFAPGSLLEKDYGPFARELLKTNKEILGLSVLDHEGKIIRVYPPATNINALGKITQNFVSLTESYKRQEKYWLSPPFKLYQGCDGFAFYVPILDGKKLKGWFAPLICNNLFVERFRHSSFFESYELIIKDKETNLSFFATALLPEPGLKTFESEHIFFGRELIFQSWRKDRHALFEIPKYWTLIGAFLLSTLSFYLFQFYQQRMKARSQLQEISVLLKFTSKEALTNLIEAQTEQTSLKSKEDINFLSNLIEQIDLLQTMAHTGEGLRDEDLDLIPLIQEPLQNLADVIEKKALKINLKADDFKNVSISINGWLIQNSVLASILSHSIIYASYGSVIEITHSESNDTHFIVFHSLKLGPDLANNALVFDRRLQVARKVLDVHHGDLFVQSDLAEGMIIRMTLPV